MLVASGATYVASGQIALAAFCRHLALPPHGLLVGLLLVGPPRVVFALTLVVGALALVDPLLLEVAGPLLGVMRKLPTPVGRALALKRLDRLDRLDRLRIIGTVVLLFAVHPGAIGFVTGLAVVQLALFAVAAVLVVIEQPLFAVELPLLGVTVTTLAHYSVFLRTM
jgi:hypothetical protein